MQELYKSIKILEGTPEETAGVSAAIGLIKDSIKNTNLKSELDTITTVTDVNDKIINVQEKIEQAKQDPITKKLVDAKADLETADATLSQKLTETNMGEMLAAIEMGSASATLNITKSQLESAKDQLESAEEQLDDAWDQISDAQEQLNDARKQLSEGWDSIREGEEDLAEAKADALESADMTDILTVEMVENLLAAQNFSMPAGYVTEEGIDYLVRVGEKVDDVESLQNMVLIDMEMDGVDTIHLGDVADVFMTDNSDEVYASINGQAGVMLTKIGRASCRERVSAWV